MSAHTDILETSVSTQCFDILSLVTIKHEWETDLHFYVVRTEDIKPMTAAEIVKVLTSTSDVDRFVVPTEEYLKHYVNAPQYEYEYDTGLYIDDIKEITNLLVEGKFDLFVNDTSWYDGWMRTVSGEVIPRKLFFDSIEGFSGTYKEMLKKLEKIKKDKRTSYTKMEEIPYYNVMEDRTHGIRFHYRPTKNEIDLLLENSWEGKQAILSRWL